MRHPINYVTRNAPVRCGLNMISCPLVLQRSKMNYRAWNHRCWLVSYMTTEQVTKCLLCINALECSCSKTFSGQPCPLKCAL